MTSTRPTRYDRNMMRLMNDPRGRRLYATATRRRLVVAVHITLTTALGALMTYAYLADEEPAWPFVVMVVVLLPWMVATGAINGATRGLLELRERVLDERQSAERSHVLARAHRVMTLLLATTAAGLLVMGGVDGDAPMTYAAPVLIAVLVVHWLMPLWVAGLMAQDEPGEDEEVVV
ncbi:hypothetical protein [Streptomyces sp. NPDC005009]